MESTTKTQIDRRSIEKVCERIYGEKCVIGEIIELTDGCYNASYLIQVISENKDIILKAAPSDKVSILSYEKDIMKTEVALYKLVKETTVIPIPGLIDANFDRDLLPVPYFISERLYGQPLNKFESISYEQRKALYLQMAKYLALLHKTKGDTFGYPNMNWGVVTYKEAFRNMIEAVLSDGKKVEANFPMPYEDFMALFDKHSKVLDEVSIPTLVHFDLWDGNVFVTGMEENPTIEGLIDFERSFYGDPLVDFVQVSFYIDLKTDHYFIETYNAYADEKITLGSKEMKRILLHKIYLFIIMIVECKYRDVNGSYDGQLHWASEEFIKLVQQLKESGE